MPFQGDWSADGQEDKLIIRYFQSRSEISIGRNIELGLACAIRHHAEAGDAVRTGKVDIAILLGIEDQMVEFRHDLRQLRKIRLIRGLMQAREPARDKDLACLDLVEHGPQHIEGPLLRRLDQNGVAVELTHELAILLHFANHAAQSISRHLEIPDHNAVVREETPLPKIARGDGDIVSRSHHAFGDLAHDLLHAAAAGMIVFATEQQSHRLSIVLVWH